MDFLSMWRFYVLKTNPFILGLCGLWNGDSSDDRNGDDRQHPNDFIESFR